MLYLCYQTVISHSQSHHLTTAGSTHLHPFQMATYSHQIEAQGQAENWLKRHTHK